MLDLFPMQNKAVNA